MYTFYRWASAFIRATGPIWFLICPELDWIVPKRLTRPISVSFILLINGISSINVFLFPVIEVACQEYGNFQDKLVEAIDNGKICYKNTNRIGSSSTLPVLQKVYEEESQIMEQYSASAERIKTNWITQYNILLMRMWKQMWRDKVVINWNMECTKK